MSLEPAEEALLREVVETLGLEPFENVVIKFGRFENVLGSKLLWRVVVQGNEVKDVRTFEQVSVHENRGCFWSILYLLLGNRFVQLNYESVIEQSAVAGPLAPGQWGKIREQAAELRGHLAEWAKNLGLVGSPLQLSCHRNGWAVRGPGWRGSFEIRPFEVRNWQRSRVNDDIGHDLLR